MRLAVVVLAAGLGTRMRSATPKLLHNLYGKSIVRWVVDAVMPLRPRRTVIVMSTHTRGIVEDLDGYPVTYALQKKPRGTGDAVRAAMKELGGFDGTVLVLNGDAPLVPAETLRTFLSLHRRRRDDLSILSFTAEGPHAYGRIVRDGGAVKSIVEHLSATDSQRAIGEVNSGVYALKSEVLTLLKRIKVDPVKGEYYLTDLVSLAVQRGYRVGAHPIGTHRESIGINTRADLEQALRHIRDRLVVHWMERGVTFIDTSSVFIDPSAQIGNDTVIYPNVVIEGPTVIGQECVLYPNTRIVNSVIGRGVTIKDSTVIESSDVRDKAVLGPFSHLRPGSVIGAGAKIGNFVEVKKSSIGDGTKAMHLSYLGDAEVGRHVNIGAGTITCNYDGRDKHLSKIEDDVFIGSDSQLVAPVRIGRGAYVGAGSTITKDVPSQALGLSRAPQVNVQGWALRKTRARDGKKNKK